MVAVQGRKQNHRCEKSSAHAAKGVPGGGARIDMARMRRDQADHLASQVRQAGIVQVAVDFLRQLCGSSGYHTPAIGEGRSSAIPFIGHLLH